MYDPRTGRIGGGASGQRTAQQPVPQVPDFQKILANQPGYQFQLQQGEQAAQRNLAARGLLNSGAGLKALTQYGQGMASSYADKYTAGLASLAGLGGIANSQTGQAGAYAANQIGSSQLYAGNAAAAGYANQANAWQSGLAGIGQAYGQYQNYQQQQQGLSAYENNIASVQIPDVPTYYGAGP
jgi:hypothetical protein